MYQIRPPDLSLDITSDPKVYEKGYLSEMDFDYHYPDALAQNGKIVKRRDRDDGESLRVEDETSGA